MNGPVQAPHAPPPVEAACLYDGHVTHARLRPVPHRFRYRVFSLLIDLDRLAEADAASALFSVNRGNLVAFREADHGRRDGAPLAGQARQLAREAGVESEIAHVLLLCYPRILGYAFNPISVYYLYGRDGELACILYEVRNTFSETHTYVCPVRPGEIEGGALRQSRDKLLYVSPFIDMAMRYEFCLRPPSRTLSLRIGERDRDGVLLMASFAGAKRALTTRQLIACCLAIPAMTLKVIGAIHWQALRLWLKGVRLVRRPVPPPDTASVATRGTPGSHRCLARGVIAGLDPPAKFSDKLPSP